MVSPTRNELITNLVDYIELATSLPRGNIIRGKQNAPSSTNNYCTLLYVTDTPDGTVNINTSQIIGDETKLDYNMRGKRKYLFSIQFYRTGATDLAKQLLMFHQTPAGTEFQQTGLFTVSMVSSVSEAAEVMSKNYEERAIVSFNIIVAERQVIEINKVASVDINVEFDGNSIVSDSIEVTNG